jgi:hypothetical protein
MPDQPKDLPERALEHSTWSGGIRKLWSLCNNPLSMLGLLAVGLSLLLLIVFTMFNLFAPGSNPYLDIVSHLLLPSVLVAGLIAVPIGVAWKWRWLRKHKGQEVPRYVQIDLRDRPTRGAILVFVAVPVFLVMPGLAVSAYRGYVYTESTEFCAEVCHEVMKPQGTAHADSAHARVSCAACHIGAGAGWFVKSKLSGTRQVIAVWRNSFSRPIPPAIQKLRPARETCEECHWPARFFGSQLRQLVYYSPDEANTRREVRMLLKIGGADESTGRVQGIHMHMLSSGQIEYVATDEDLQEIPWIRYLRPDGSVSIYRSDGQSHDAPPPEGIRRTIDCMDCHNRGAHHFLPPQRAIDQQLEMDRIDPGLPYVKREAVRALVGDYRDADAAREGIGNSLRTFYQQEYPEVWEQRAPAVEQAIAAVQEVYDRNFFPSMRVTWRTYPENVGHMMFPGCFRCHDGLHRDEQGRAVSPECTLCHTFLNRVADQPHQFREGKFEHSMSLVQHEELRCSQCHSGGPLKLCRDCHADLQGLDRWEDQPRLRRGAD